MTSMQRYLLSILHVLPHVAFADKEPERAPTFAIKRNLRTM
jgi:hypothetical protein